MSQQEVLERKDLVLLSTKAFEGKQGIIIVKTNKGYYSLDIRYGLYVCSNCRDVLNQEFARDDDLCPCCRLQINLDKACEQIERLGL